MIKKIITAIALSTTLVAYEIWVDDIAALYYGQKNILEASVKDKKVTQDEILKLSCLKDNKIFELEINKVKDKSFKDSCDAIFVELRRAYYTKTPFGTKKVSKDKTKMPLKSFQSVESIKQLYKNDAIKLFNAPLELSPRVSFENIKVGDRVRLIVTSYGRGKAGVEITYNKKVIAKSDADGHVSLLIKKAGTQKITASYKEKGDGIKCDEVIHSTTLNMEVSR